MIASAIVSFGILIALAYVFYGPWRSVCVDYTRQYIFEKRDELFDLAASGKIEFSSEEYRRARSLLEKIIRYAHEASLGRILVNAWSLRSIPVDAIKQTSPWEKINDVETRKKVSDIIHHSLMAVMLLIMATSVLLIAAVICLMVGALIKKVIEGNAVIELIIEDVAEVSRRPAGAKLETILRREAELTPDYVNPLKCTA